MTPRAYALGAAALLLFAVAATASLELYGRSCRTFLGIPGPLRPPAVTGAIVERPEDAYRLWKDKGAHGRIVAVLAGRWDRVLIDSFKPYLTSAAFPKAFFDPFTWWEKELNGANFLFLAAQKGIAREIVCILPEQEYRRLFDSADESGPVPAGPVTLKTYEGYRRAFAADPRAIPLAEPVLLYIGASFLEAQTSGAARAMMENSGWTTDFAVFCAEGGDKCTSAEARERLAELAAAMGARPAPPSAGGAR